MTDQTTEQKPSFGEAIDLIEKTLKNFDERMRRTMIITVCDLLQIKVDAPAATNQERQKDAASGSVELRMNTERKPPSPTGTDIRSLKDEKKPRSAQQMAVLAAYYALELAPEEERKEVITTKDLDRYFKQAKFEIPKKLEQVLDKGKRAGYFESPSRGNFKLTRVGYNLAALKMPLADGE